MDEVWQEIRTELLKQPDAQKAQQVRPYAPFVFRGELYCRVEVNACAQCPFDKLKDDHRACHSAPSCDVGHFEVFTPEHYAMHVARTMNGGNDG